MTPPSTFQVSASSSSLSPLGERERVSFRASPKKGQFPGVYSQGKMEVDAFFWREERAFNRHNFLSRTYGTGEKGEKSQL